MINEKPSAVIAYRANEIFDKDAPIVRDELSNLGYDVDIKRFEGNANERDISDWAKKNLFFLEKQSLVLSDRTVLRGFQKPDRLNLFQYQNRYTFLGEVEVVVDTLNLDELSEEALIREVPGEWRCPDDEDFDIIQEDSEGELDLYKGLYQRSLKKLDPKETYIIREKLSQHEPFAGRWGDASVNVNPEADANSAEMMRNWIEQTGIVSVNVLGSLSELLEKQGDNLSICIFDRHYFYQHPQKIKGHLALATPFENFWYDLTQAGFGASVDYSKSLRELFQSYHSRKINPQ